MAAEKYYISEIAAATGIDRKTLNARKAALVKAGELVSVKGKASEFTYEEVKMLLRERRKPGQPRPVMVNNLKRLLQNDGFQIKKGAGA